MTDKELKYESAEYAEYRRSKTMATEKTISVVELREWCEELLRANKRESVK